MNKKIVYTGIYKGVGYEINSWEQKNYHDGQMETKWTYYLIIQLGRIPGNADKWWLKAERKKLTPDSTNEFISYNEYDSVCGSVEMHGGITWYSKESTEDNTPEERVIKIGCDYSHYGDEGREYTIDWVEQDVKNSIESFRKLEPKYKYYCQTVGGYWDISEGELRENGSFISNKGKEYRIKQGWDKPETDEKAEESRT